MSEPSVSGSGVGGSGVRGSGVGGSGVGGLSVGGSGVGGSGVQAAHAAALCRLPGMGHSSLIRLLRSGSPQQVWERVLDGSIGRNPDLEAEDARSELPFELSGPVRPGRRVDDRRRWAVAAVRIDPPRWWERYAASGIGVVWWGSPGYPEALLSDPEPPAVLFVRGSIGWLERPCVSIVGTRRASPDGRAIAFELGRDLAASGVCVVSGLALGIDGAAHVGAVSVAAEEGSSGPVGVAASGVDVPYPKRHAGLWERVAATGALISETLPGRPPEAWRFPARNRIIAGLSRMVVVVESHARGGSLITAEAAIARGIDVRVVPGPVHSSASEGTNQLLYDGPGPVRNAQDVLDGLGIFRSSSEVVSSAGAALSGEGGRGAGAALSGEAGRGAGAALSGPARKAIEATSWSPTSLHQIVERSGLPVPAVMAALDELEQSGLLTREGGWWTRRKAPT